MAMLQEMMQQMGGPPSAGDERAGGAPAQESGEDDGPHKDWVCVYPIYLDAKRHYRKGCRRVPYEKSVLYPNSLFIANAANYYNLEFVHQPHRRHPQDWENPGRVKVRLFDENKKPFNAKMPTSASILCGVG